MNRASFVGLALLACGLALGACVQSVPRNPLITLPVSTSTPSATPAPATPPPEPTATPTVPPTSSAAPTAAAAPTPTATVKAAPTAPVQRFGLFLEIEGLGDENVVRGDTITARGKTSPDAIVSINGVIIPIDADGNFTVQLTLEPGPNEIVVVASDLDGNEISKVLAVVALPEAPPS